MKYLNGYPVVVSPDMDNQPKIRLRHDAPVTADFRAEYQAWLTEFFGTEDCIYFIQRNGRDTIVCGPNSVAKIEKLYPLSNY